MDALEYFEKCYWNHWLIRNREDHFVVKVNLPIQLRALRQSQKFKKWGLMGLFLSTLFLIGFLVLIAVLPSFLSDVLLVLTAVCLITSIFVLLTSSDKKDMSKNAIRFLQMIDEVCEIVSKDTTWPKEVVKERLLSSGDRVDSEKKDFSYLFSEDRLKRILDVLAIGKLGFDVYRRQTTGPINELAGLEADRLGNLMKEWDQYFVYLGLLEKSSFSSHFDRALNKMRKEIQEGNKN